MAERAIVAGEADVEAGGAEVVDAGGERGGADAVAERDFLGGGERARRIAVLAAAQILLAEREERRLADAAGDHDQVVGRLGRKAVAERAPDVELVARSCAGPAGSVILPSTR